MTRYLPCGILVKIDYILLKGADMNYKGKGQMTLSDRIVIEIGIYRKESFKQIAKQLGRHPSTIAHEVKVNRTYIQGSYFAGVDCKFVRQCKERHVCGAYDCDAICFRCREKDCRIYCERYVSTACHIFESPPYVCNSCTNKRLCIKERYYYSAKNAEAIVSRRRSKSRSGIRISKKELSEMDELITSLIKKGQPLTHIYAEHQDEMPICLRSLYNYIDAGELTIRNIDLRRKTRYRQRRNGGEDKLKAMLNQAYRHGRTYADYEKYMKDKDEFTVTEMDTVKGVREAGKRLLTMILRKNSVMLLFLMPDGKAESVKQVFDFIETGVGSEVFNRLFPVILTDNGAEFKRVNDLELTQELEYRTNLFYCDPMASWQKPRIEKNHEFIRYVIPKGRSFSPYTQEDMTLLMNHINSIRRPGLGNRSPYELVEENDTDMHILMDILKMHLIPSDEVHLKPDLFTSK